MSRRITRPVIRLIQAARAMGGGDRQVRVGEVPGAPAELRDLAATFDRMADSLAAQERLRRDLVADVAHELRTPVAVLQANTEALLDGIRPHTPEETLSLHEETVRLGRMVEDLQTLAAAEAAALELRLQPCDLAQIGASAADQWEASFAAAGVSFSHELQPAPVLGDPGRLHQVITNLLSNALKFTPAGGQVQMRAFRDGGQARLEVSDTGPGIDPRISLTSSTGYGVAASRLIPPAAALAWLLPPSWSARTTAASNWPASPAAGQVSPLSCH